MATTANGRVFAIMDTVLLYSDDYGNSFRVAVNYTLSGRRFFSELYYDKSDGQLWFGTYGNSTAYKLDPKTFETKKYIIESSDTIHFGYTTDAFCRLNDSIMMVGCLFGQRNSEGSLAFLNIRRSTTRNYVRQSENPFSLISANIHCILRDCQNTFWIGTDVGINRFNLQQLNFHWISTGYYKLPGLEGFSIRQMCYDKSLWLGTYGQGLVEYTPSTQKISWYPPPSSTPDEKNKAIVFSIYPCHDTLWIGVRGGFTRFDINTHKYDLVNSAIPELKELYSNTARGIGKDNTGTFWFGTYFGDVFSYNPVTNIGVHYTGRDTNLTTKYRNHIRCLKVDVVGNKWIGTYEDGFYRMDAETKQISWNIPGDKKAAVIQRGAINDIYCDNIGNTYIATPGRWTHNI